MAPSTRTPVEVAIADRDVMLDVNFMPYKGINASRTAIGMVTIGMMAEGKCQRKRRITMLTMIISSISWLLRVSIDRLISSERSYVVTTSTPAGREGWISSGFSLTRL